MGKQERIADFVQALGAGAGSDDSHWQAYFACFQRRLYYEAHDVLEHLWLRERGPSRDFLKGMIQLAGAFVHLQKQALRPEHPKDGRRLRPAYRLLRLARGNLEAFGPFQRGMNVAGLCARCSEIEALLESGGFLQNPLVQHGGALLCLEDFGAYPGGTSAGGAEGEEGTDSAAASGSSQA